MNTHLFFFWIEWDGRRALAIRYPVVFPDGWRQWYLGRQKV